MFTLLSEDEFRLDISSTELRQVIQMKQWEHNTVELESKNSFILDEA